MNICPVPGKGIKNATKDQGAGTSDQGICSPMAYSTSGGTLGRRQFK